MRKHFSAILVLLFLCAQGISLWHMAATGSAPHTHHDRLCDFYLYSEHQNVDTPPIPQATMTDAVVVAVLFPITVQPVQNYTSINAYPRAPPTLS